MDLYEARAAGTGTQIHRGLKYVAKHRYPLLVGISVLGGPGVWVTHYGRYLVCFTGDRLAYLAGYSRALA